MEATVLYSKSLACLRTQTSLLLFPWTIHAIWCS